MQPKTLDHVAFWVADRDAVAAVLTDRLGVHVIDRQDTFTLLGADARRFKMTLFDAEGPRDPGPFVHVALRVNKLPGGRTETFCAGGGGLRFSQRSAARAIGCGSRSSSSITRSHRSISCSQQDSRAPCRSLNPTASGSAAAMRPRMEKNCSPIFSRCVPYGSGRRIVATEQFSISSMMKKGRSSGSPSISKAMGSGTGNPSR